MRHRSNRNRTGNAYRSYYRRVTSPVLVPTMQQRRNVYHTPTHSFEQAEMPPRRRHGIYSTLQTHSTQYTPHGVVYNGSAYYPPLPTYQAQVK